MSWNHVCLEIILSDRALKVWIVDDSLIPTEKFLQEERERQDRDSSLIDWSTIHDSHRTNLCPLMVLRKEMLFARTKEYYPAFR